MRSSVGERLRHYLHIVLVDDASDTFFADEFDRVSVLRENAPNKPNECHR